MPDVVLDELAASAHNARTHTGHPDSLRGESSAIARISRWLAISGPEIQAEHVWHLPEVNLVEHRTEHLRNGNASFAHRSNHSQALAVGHFKGGKGGGAEDGSEPVHKPHAHVLAGHPTGGKDGSDASILGNPPRARAFATAGSRARTRGVEGGGVEPAATGLPRVHSHTAGHTQALSVGGDRRALSTVHSGSNLNAARSNSDVDSNAGSTHPPHALPLHSGHKWMDSEIIIHDGGSPPASAAPVSAAPVSAAPLPLDTETLDTGNADSHWSPWAAPTDTGDVDSENTDTESEGTAQEGTAQGSGDRGMYPDDLRSHTPALKPRAHPRRSEAGTASGATGVGGVGGGGGAHLHSTDRFNGGGGLSGGHKDGATGLNRPERVPRVGSRGDAAAAADAESTAHLQSAVGTGGGGGGGPGGARVHSPNGLHAGLHKPEGGEGNTSWGPGGARAHSPNGLHAGLHKPEGGEGNTGGGPGGARAHTPIGSRAEATGKGSHAEATGKGGDGHVPHAGYAQATEGGELPRAHLHSSEHAAERAESHSVAHAGLRARATEGGEPSRAHLHAGEHVRLHADAAAGGGSSGSWPSTHPGVRAESAGGGGAGAGTRMHSSEQVSGGGDARAPHIHSPIGSRAEAAASGGGGGGPGAHAGLRKLEGGNGDELPRTHLHSTEHAGLHSEGTSAAGGGAHLRTGLHADASIEGHIPHADSRKPEGKETGGAHVHSAEHAEHSSEYAGHSSGHAEQHEGMHTPHVGLRAHAEDGELSGGRAADAEAALAERRARTHSQAEQRVHSSAGGADLDGDATVSMSVRQAEHYNRYHMSTASQAEQPEPGAETPASKHWAEQLPAALQGDWLFANTAQENSEPITASAHIHTGVASGATGRGDTRHHAEHTGAGDTSHQEGSGTYAHAHAGLESFSSESMRAAGARIHARALAGEGAPAQTGSDSGMMPTWLQDPSESSRARPERTPRAESSNLGHRHAAAALAADSDGGAGGSTLGYRHAAALADRDGVQRDAGALGKHRDGTSLGYRHAEALAAGGEGTQAPRGRHGDGAILSQRHTANAADGEFSSQTDGGGGAGSTLGHKHASTSAELSHGRAGGSRLSQMHAAAALEADGDVGAGGYTPGHRHAVALAGTEGTNAHASRGSTLGHRHAALANRHTQGSGNVPILSLAAHEPDNDALGVAAYMAYLEKSPSSSPSPNSNQGSIPSPLLAFNSISNPSAGLEKSPSGPIPSSNFLHSSIPVGSHPISNASPSPSPSPISTGPSAGADFRTHVPSPTSNLVASSIPAGSHLVTTATNAPPDSKKLWNSHLEQLSRPRKPQAYHSQLDSRSQQQQQPLQQSQPQPQPQPRADSDTGGSDTGAADAQPQPQQQPGLDARLEPLPLPLDNGSPTTPVPDTPTPAAIPSAITNPTTTSIFIAAPIPIIPAAASTALLARAEATERSGAGAAQAGPVVGLTTGNPGISVVHQVPFRGSVRLLAAGGAVLTLLPVGLLLATAFLVSHRRRSEGAWPAAQQMV
mmetsp:Transcript_28484/g.66777  ORF Transcript_28484/g.66777 Transcript_28484/m.66777 type:complete len:1518 (+) Transcript_28484:650-5203(+)